jgi:hypothetical protein
VVSLKHSIEQIKKSPDIDLDKPVYRQLEEQLHNYYKWAPHWTPHSGLPEPQTEPVLTGDTHLRSMNNVCKYVVQAFDGRVGSMDDIVVDDRGWRLPLVVLDTRHYLSTERVILLARHIKGIRCEDGEISIDMSKAEVERAPADFDPARALEEYV